MIKAIFFDLFFTLVTPKYSNDKNEYDVLGITRDLWELYAENDALYRERAIGKITDQNEIIKKIAALMPFHVTEEQQKEVLTLRQNRMKRALLSVDDCIVKTLTQLKNKGMKLCLISNADKIDCEYWRISPLANIFDQAIFSCDVGLLKPNKEIYEYAMRQTKVESAESIFVGDGDSSELAGAKNAGMRTVFTEYLDQKDHAIRNKLLCDADYHMDKFVELMNFIY